MRARRLDHENYERLSAQDAAFLYAESPVLHMHVGSLVVFENVGLTEDELNAHIASRLHLVPRFRKKLAWVPAYQGRPVWVDDPHFDIRFHVRYTGLPRPSGEREAVTLMGRVMSRPLDRQRPLWELWVFELPENRLGMIHKTHHCLIDGISGVDLATVLLDVAKDPPPGDPAPTWRPAPIPSKKRLLFDALVDRYTQPAEIYRSVKAATRPSARAREARGRARAGPVLVQSRRARACADHVAEPTHRSAPPLRAGAHAPRRCETDQESLRLHGERRGARAGDQRAPQALALARRLRRGPDAQGNGSGERA